MFHGCEKIEKEETIMPDFNGFSKELPKNMLPLHRWLMKVMDNK
jgi:hypothetical protein